MASINISDLRPAGTELFSDSESYMNEVSEGEFFSIKGGTSPTITITITLLLVGDSRQQKK